MNKRIISILLTIVIVFTNTLIINAQEVKAESSSGKEIRSLSSQTSSKNIFSDSKVQPQVAGGFNYSVLLKDDGTVWTCGADDLAQGGSSGHYYGDDYSRLKQVNGLSDVIAIDCADAFTLALKSDGTVWGWGWNGYYGLGRGKPQTCVYATRMADISDAKAIACGNHMSIFVKKDGTVWYTCRQNGKAAGKLRTMKELKDIISVKTAHQCAIALSRSGEVWTWEWEGNDDGYTISTPKKQKLKNIKAVESGEFQYMALDKDGVLWLWGMNNSGEIGDGTHEWCYSPKKILTNVKLMTGGGYYSMAELNDGIVYAWGDNSCGQFGNNSKKSTTKPVKVTELKDVIAMDAGMYHTLAIKSNGEVVVMGNNYDGVLGLGNKKEHNTPALLIDLKKKTNASDSSEEILPNGDISDWGDVKPIATGTVPANGKQVGIKALYAKFVGYDLYLAASLTDGLPAYVNFGLDTDGDNKINYKISFTDDKFAEVHYYKKTGNTYKKICDDYGAYGSVVELEVNFPHDEGWDDVAVIATYGADKKKYGINSEIRSYTVVPEDDFDYVNSDQEASPTVNPPKSNDEDKPTEAPKKVTFGPITLDGKLEDWNNINKTVIEDPANDSVVSKADVTTIYVARDTQYLYLAAKVTGDTPSVNTKLDYNGDNGADYGANASSQNKEVYYFFFSDTGITEAGRSEDVVYQNDVLEFVVPLSAIGNPKDKVAIHIWADMPGDHQGEEDNVEGYIDVVVTGV
jgi:alpha-tubulin suppressor-like RCC1 family protein